MLRGMDDAPEVTKAKRPRARDNIETGSPDRLVSEGVGDEAEPTQGHLFWGGGGRGTLGFSQEDRPDTQRARLLSSTAKRERVKAGHDGGGEGNIRHRFDEEEEGDSGGVTVDDIVTNPRHTVPIAEGRRKRAILDEGKPTERMRSVL